MGEPGTADVKEPDCFLNLAPGRQRTTGGRQILETLGTGKEGEVEGRSFTWPAIGMGLTGKDLQQGQMKGGRRERRGSWVNRPGRQVQ